MSAQRSLSPSEDSEEVIVSEWSWDTPNLGMGLSEVIYTGHRANIFSVKFAPGKPSRLFSAAGDSEIRIFDFSLPNVSGEVMRGRNRWGGRREWTEYGTESGMLMRVLRCHTDRVKRIATEDSEDIFLTCSEDGTVRQHDLRVHHNCRLMGLRNHNFSSCPPPLVDYSASGLSFYSLSLSKIRPYLFTVAGTSPYAYLHDRRMLPRPMLMDWGVHPVASLETQCVRRFGLPTVEVYEEVNKGPGGEEIRKKKRRRRRDRHITATKMSDNNGRELLVSYSGGPVYIFDIFDSPDFEPTAQLARPTLSKRQRSGEEGSDEGPKKKKMSAPSSPNQASSSALARTDTSSEEADGAEQRNYSYEVTIGENGEVKVDVQISSGAEPHADPIPEIEMGEGSGQPAESSQVEVVVPQGDESEAQASTDLSADPVDMPPLAEQLEKGVEVLPQREMATEPAASSPGGEAPMSSGMEPVADEEGEEATMEDDEDDEDDEEELFMFSSRHRRSYPEKDVPVVFPLRSFDGHLNSATVKDVNFTGPKDEFVISGSDDGNFFIWNKETTELVGIYEGDSDTVNVMQTHPKLPVLAISGIDQSVKIFAPTTSNADDSGVKVSRRFAKLENAEAIRQNNMNGRRRMRLPPSTIPVSFYFSFPKSFLPILVVDGVMWIDN
ncbi:WD40 repeat-like protein [Atractiella rhizophila]|nr:WD40 repeat-like protein [Atractiella rhizophila]